MSKRRSTRSLWVAYVFSMAKRRIASLSFVGDKPWGG